MALIKYRDEILFIIFKGRLFFFVREATVWKHFPNGGLYRPSPMARSIEATVSTVANIDPNEVKVAPLTRRSNMVKYLGNLHEISSVKILVKGFVKHIAYSTSSEVNC